ncbi:MAG: hypothetical protein V7629_19980 [Motiliproteus sp.]
MKHLAVTVSVLLLALAGCAPPAVQPQQGTQSGAATTNTYPQTVVPKHNLSQKAKANKTTPEMLATLVEGKTSIAQLVELLGEIKPYTLGDGKKIYRYDIGTYIFGADGVLLRHYPPH